jgi:hypothetical protein
MIGLSATGLRSKIQRLNLFNGGDWLGSFYPVIIDTGSIYDWNGLSGATPSALANGPFKSTDWSLQNGFNGSALNTTITTNNVAGGAFLDTGVAMNSTSYQNGSVHMAVYVNTIGTKTGGMITDIGVKTNANSTTALRACYVPYPVGGRGEAGFITYNGAWETGTTNALCYTAANNPLDPRGFAVGSRTNFNSTTYYRNNVIPPAYNNGSTQFFYNPNNTTYTLSNTYNNSTVTVFAFGGNNTQGSASKTCSEYSDRAMTMYSIGTGLTNADVANYTTLIQQFNTNIGRTNYV